MTLGLYFAMVNTLTLPVKRKGSMIKLLPDAFAASNMSLTTLPADGSKDSFAHPEGHRPQ